MSLLFHIYQVGTDFAWWADCSLSWGRRRRRAWEDRWPPPSQHAQESARAAGDQEGYMHPLCWSSSEWSSWFWFAWQSLCLMIRWKDGSSWLAADQADRVDIKVIGAKKMFHGWPTSSTCWHNAFVAIPLWNRRLVNLRLACQIAHKSNWQTKLFKLDT